MTAKFLSFSFECSRCGESKEWIDRMVFQSDDGKLFCFQCHRAILAEQRFGRLPQTEYDVEKLAVEQKRTFVHHVKPVESLQDIVGASDQPVLAPLTRLDLSKPEDHVQAQQDVLDIMDEKNLASRRAYAMKQQARQKREMGYGQGRQPVAPSERPDNRRLDYSPESGFAGYGEINRSATPKELNEHRLANGERKLTQGRHAGRGETPKAIREESNAKFAERQAFQREANINHALNHARGVKVIKKG